MVWQEFKEGRGIQGGKGILGGKRHARREKAFKEGRGIQGGNFWLGPNGILGGKLFVQNFFFNLKLYILLVIPVSWEVYR